MAIKPGSIQVAIRQSPDHLKATYVQARQAPGTDGPESMSDEGSGSPAVLYGPLPRGLRARSVLLVGGGHHTNTEREEQVPFPEQWLYT